MMKMLKKMARGSFVPFVFVALTGCWGAAEGMDGMDGIDGKDGARGPAGADGADGQDGEDGTDGEDGAQGPAGPAGADGEDGADGQDGTDGADGQDGRDGVDGADGEDATCTVDSNCPTGSICEDGFCVIVVDNDPDPECTNNADCGDWVCDDGQCEQCRVDSDCESGEICDDGRCLTPECDEDSDCAAHEQCNAGTCVDKPDYCDSDTDCASDEECVNNCCVAEEPEPEPECDSNADCDADEVCSGGECVPDPDDDGTNAGRTVPFQLQYTLPESIPGLQDISIHVVYENKTLHTVCDTDVSPSGFSVSGLVYTCNGFRSPLEIPDYGWVEVVGTQGVSGFPNFSGTIYGVWGEGSCSSTSCLRGFGDLEVDNACQMSSDDWITNGSGGGNYDFGDCVF